MINHPSESRPVRLCKEETISKVSTAIAPEFGPRGDAAKCGKAKVKVHRQDNPMIHALSITYIGVHMQLLGDTVTPAMTELGKGIVDAAQFATGFSQ